MRQRIDVYSMPESGVDSGLHVISQEPTTMFMTLAVQHCFENNSYKTVITSHD